MKSRIWARELKLASRKNETKNTNWKSQSSPKCAISFPDPIQVRNGVSSSLLGFHLSILPAYSYYFETKHKSNLGPKFEIETQWNETQWTTELIETRQVSLLLVLFYCGILLKEDSTLRLQQIFRQTKTNDSKCSSLLKLQKQIKVAENKSQDLSGSNCSTFQRIFNKDSYFQWFRILQVVVNIDLKIKSEYDTKQFRSKLKIFKSVILNQAAVCQKTQRKWCGLWDRIDTKWTQIVDSELNQHKEIACGLQVNRHKKWAQSGLGFESTQRKENLYKKIYNCGTPK